MQARPKNTPCADGLAEDEGADERADDRLDARHDTGLAALDVGEALGVEDVGRDGGEQHESRSEEGVLRHVQNRHKVAPSATNSAPSAANTNVQNTTASGL